VSKLAFVDTETTGLDPDRHEIWEVGLIVDEKEYEWQLPVDLGRADAKALSIGGFHQRRYAPAALTDLRYFATRFAELTRKRHLVGAVVSFDEERLRKLLRANGACPEWHYHLIDIEALAVGYLHGRGGMVAGEPGEWLPGLPWDSDELSAALGVSVPVELRHTALGDARWAKAIYEKVSYDPRRPT